MKPVRNNRFYPRMKNYLALVLLLLPFLSQAQRRGGNFRLGFTTSPTFGWMKFEDENGAYRNDGTATGYSYGIMGDFGFTDNYFFGSGFTLTTMASNVQVTLPGGTERINYKTQYIDIPLTLKLKTNPDTRARFYGQFGPDLGIKVSAKHTFTNVDIPDDANLLRLGLLVGAGAEWKLKGSNILTGVSFNNPFTRVFDDPRAKNYIVTLNVGVFF